MIHVRILLFALALVLNAACQSQEATAQPPLPFHVAVVPLEPTENSALEPSGMEGDPLTEVQLSFDAARTTARLVEALNGKSFTRATQLVYPEGGMESIKLDEDRQDYWIKQADGIGADLVLLADFEYFPTIWSNTNSNFWLNLPLFLLGGPFCYVVNDRDYHAAAQIRAQFFNVKRLRTANAGWASRGSKSMDLDTDLKVSNMDFWDRADGHLGRFALSLVIPAGLLATETSGVRDTLERDIVGWLATDLTDKIRVSGDQVTRGSLHDFWMEHESLGLGSDGSQQVLVGRAVLQRGGEADALRQLNYSLEESTSSYRLLLADGVYEEGRSGHMVTYDFAIPLGNSGLPSAVHITIVDDTGEARNYTVDPRDYLSGI